MGEAGGYRVAVLGNCCTHGEFVVAALKAEAGAELVGGWEGDPRRRPGLATALGMDLAAAPEALIEDPRVDIVALACSPHDKADWVERAAAAGKHIFLNKPMCESLTSARRIKTAVEAHDVRLVHDISVIRFHPVTAKLMADARAGALGRPIHYAASYGMTFSADFPLAEVWPERLDPPRRSGGGEMTNMGCYAIDYMVALFGRPRAVQAKRAAFWDVYAAARVENFGQIIADYGAFFAVLATGKQPLAALPSVGVDEALETRYWHNVIELQCEHHNLTVLPFHDLVIRDGERMSASAYVAGDDCPSPFAQLVGAIGSGVAPDSGVEAALAGVEVLMAAYRSCEEDGARIDLPLGDGANPLVAASG